jgi:hypothetical protein
MSEKSQRTEKQIKVREMPTKARTTNIQNVMMDEDIKSRSRGDVLQNETSN